MKPMKPEAQNAILAEACGWRYFEKYERPGFVMFGGCWIRGEAASTSLPDYFNDLNAVHDAEKVLCRPLTLEEARYGVWLRGVTHRKDGARLMFEYDNPTLWPPDVPDWCDTVLLWGAEAAQRCEALLRMLGKWDDAK